jgi:hypothetical protein
LPAVPGLRPASETPSAGTADSYERASVEDMAEALEKLPRYSIWGSLLNARLERLGAGGLQRI